MKTLRDLRFLALSALMAAVACDDSGTELALDQVTPAEALELAVLADEGSFDVAVTLTTVMNDVAMVRGNSGALQAQSLNAEAKAAFAEARAAMLAGDHRRALELSDIARRLVARALIATGGLPTVDDLIERLEDILLTLDVDVVDDPDALRVELETIIAEAKALLEAGDSVGAAARAILGEQRLRFHRGRRDHRGDIAPERARLDVALAGSAVRLAERLINAQILSTDVASSDRPDRQQRWLAHAKKMLERAETALSNGHFARALHFAQHAQWSALKAVILPGGITEQEVRDMVELAQDLHKLARAEVGDDPIKVRLWNRAGDLIEIGLRKLEAGHKRGVAALWRAAVISHWLIS
jgi:hypothetical protein